MFNTKAFIYSFLVTILGVSFYLNALAADSKNSYSKSYEIKVSEFDKLKNISQIQSSDYKSSINYDFFALCYHDVVPYIRGDLNKDAGALSVAHLIQHFKWLKDNGYTVVSLDQINRAKQGSYQLPKKSVLLTFDDGYLSFYTQIYPLLKQYQYPAVFALVTDWIESKKPIQYGKQVKSAKDFLTWEQVKEMQKSGLVEIASHTNNLHYGVTANPQGNQLPAATTRIFSNKTAYESEHAYHKRIKTDLAKSYNQILSKTGIAPKTLVWPYGSHSNLAWDIAQSIGFKNSLVLEKGQNKVSAGQHINRYLISDNLDVKGLAKALRPYSNKAAKRLIHVDLDYVYDPDPVQQQKNLSLLLDRVVELQISTVYLQAFADPDGDGNADALYFPNKQLPVKADLFNRVAWQLKTRANVDVYAWMPVTAFDFGADFYNQHGVKSIEKNAIIPSRNNYQRQSIFSEQARKKIFDIYNDLGTYAYFVGILYHDDAFLTDFEDVSPAALNYYKAKGLQFSHWSELRQEPLLQKWTKLKTQALIDFTHELTRVLKVHLPQIKTARNIYAQPLLNPDSEKWFAQELLAFTNAYDYTAIMAMPFMEKAEDPVRWMEDLVNTLEIASSKHIIRDKLVFELQSKDWNSKSPIEEKVLRQQMEFLQQKGFINFGYYPDDFINNHPALEKIKPALSTQSNILGARQ